MRDDAVLARDVEDLTAALVRLEKLLPTLRYRRLAPTEVRIADYLVGIDDVALEWCVWAVEPTDDAETEPRVRSWLDDSLSAREAVACAAAAAVSDLLCEDSDDNAN